MDFPRRDVKRILLLQTALSRVQRPPRADAGIPLSEYYCRVTQREGLS